MPEILSQIIQGSILIVVAYLVYYARQKGKNQADKNDLKDITNTVEEVKQKYNEDNELLRANLNMLISKRNLLFNEEKEAIIRFFAQLNKWIWEGLNVHIAEYHASNHQNINEKLIQMRDDQNKTNIAFAQLQLLVKDEKLIQVGHDALMQTLDLHHFTEEVLRKLRNSLSSEKILADQILSDDFDFSKLSEELKDFYQRRAEKVEKESKSAIDEYFKKHKELFSPAISLRNDFKDMGKKYLNK